MITHVELRKHKFICKCLQGLSASAFVVFEGLGYGVSSFIVAFLYQAEVAGVTLAAVPLLIISAGIMMFIMENVNKVVTTAYGKVKLLKIIETHRQTHTLAYSHKHTLTHAGTHRHAQTRIHIERHIDTRRHTNS